MSDTTKRISGATFTPPLDSGTDEEVKTLLIPTIESTIFGAESTATFAIGEVAATDARHGTFVEEFDGAARLRARTYMASGFVRPDDLDAKGTELDADGSRAEHFLVLERGRAPETARVVGTMRLVVKDRERPAPLPIERFFPELFDSSPLPYGTVEVSRLISRHEIPAVQQWIKWPLFVAGHHYVVTQGLARAYGLLTVDLTERLARAGVPLVPLAAAKHIPEIHASKQPVLIDVLRLGTLITAAGMGNYVVARDEFLFVDPPVSVL